MRKFILSFVLVLEVVFGRPVFADGNSLDRIVGPDGKMGNLNSTNIVSGALNTTSTVPGIIANIIKVILGLFGVVALVFVIWGGVTWMSSKGDSNKIKSAKDRMIAAFVGLAIIAVSYSITDFVIAQIAAIAG